jgi:tight adherence protein C
MTTMTFLAWGGTFIAIVLMTYGLVMAYGSRRLLRKRMEEPKARRPQATVSVLRQEEAANPLLRRLFNWLTLSGQWGLRDQQEVSRVRELLIHGGFRNPKAPAILHGLKVTMGLLLPVPFVLYLIMHEKVNSTTLMVAFLLAGLGYFLPQIVLGHLVKGRQEKINRALPDVLDLFIICMEAGLALQATIKRVADEIRPVCPEFYKELQITGGEMRTGISRDLALKNLGQRTGVQSVQSLVTLMIQSERLGTSIAQSLRTHADFVRVQRTLRAEERAAKLPVKILFPMMFFIFPAMFIVIIGPGIIKIAKELLPTLYGH